MIDASMCIVLLNSLVSRLEVRKVNLLYERALGGALEEFVVECPRELNIERPDKRECSTK